MSYDRVKKAKTLFIGAKQTKKAIEQGSPQQVVIARDADDRIRESLADLCRNYGVSVVYVDSMKELGKACGIDVGAATAAIID
ncbi:ribosomal L7Ae/L30e/S12e/Gadd45 family protein [Paludifilum halophilum]|uniref:50S ribosomal protein L7ae-like protein n=1 Tax=Paludifilum halophilum TaxID=1642702 RepID=A0A235B2N5_9BACL|nr:ribosomal L7Ae/L30e/S12e/Gadd45 family protein [Paludifilum halophilum]OYD06544.1 50S ribosomal protein L7ae-like protein [Paludifilum halophilum]